MIREIAHNLFHRMHELQTPANLKKRHISLDDLSLKELENSINVNFFQGPRSKENYTDEGYRSDLETHLNGRLYYDRFHYIPWLNKSVRLEGARVLEIGCGTGSSTVAFAEQGADVTGVDIDEGALKVAADRCRLYGLEATFISGTTDDVLQRVEDHKFDLIIFFASIEHMIYSERIESIKRYYDLLPGGACLSIIEAPNRLWYMDAHTSRLPFFNWLPDELAYSYSKFSTRNNFRELFLNYSDELFLHFLRQGRGFSFHELELALDIPARELQVVDFFRRPLMPFSLESRYRKLLVKIYPGISEGFFYPLIDIIIKK